MRVVEVWASTLIVGVLAAGPVGAAVAPRMALDDLIVQADAVVMARCLGAESQWLGGDLVTLAEVTVTEHFKGPDAPSMVVVLPGGVDATGPAPLAMDYSGAPTLRVDEEYVLFLRSIPELPDHFTILGYSQGHFRILRPPGAAAKAVRDLSGITLHGPDGLRRGTVTREPLDALRERITSRLNDPPQAGPEPTGDTGDESPRETPASAGSGDTNP